MGKAEEQPGIVDGNERGLASVQRGLGFIDAMTRPLPHQRGRPFYQQVVRLIAGAFGGRIIEIRGIEHITTTRDPFVLALNHTQKLEALFIPATIGCLREGKLVRFIADWNLQLIPGLRVIYRAGQVILLDRKPARPKFLNVFRPWLTDREPAMAKAARLLREGHPVGVFPEGTTNRDPKNLLRGFHGAAGLSLAEGVPVVPAGVRFPGHTTSGPIGEFEKMTIEFGAPMIVPEKTEKPNRRLVHQWHGDIMREISRLSGKGWEPGASRKKNV